MHATEGHFPPLARWAVAARRASLRGGNARQRPCVAAPHLAALDRMNGRVPSHLTHVPKHQYRVHYTQSKQDEETVETVIVRKIYRGRSKVGPKSVLRLGLRCIDLTIKLKAKNSRQQPRSGPWLLPAVVVLADVLVIPADGDQAGTLALDEDAMLAALASGSCTAGSRDVDLSTGDVGTGVPQLSIARHVVVNLAVISRQLVGQTEGTVKPLPVDTL